jgi:hypothetical protein
VNGTPIASTTITFSVIDRSINTPPLLLTEENSDMAIAFNATTFVRGPFSMLTDQNFSSDKRTRVSLFVSNFDPSSSPLVQGNSAVGSLNMPIEHIGALPGFDDVTQITIVLPDGMENASDVWLRVMVNGMMSNQGRITLQQSSLTSTMLKLLDDSWFVPDFRFLWPIPARRPLS